MGEWQIANGKRIRFTLLIRHSPLDHHHLGAELHALIEVDDGLVAHADAARRHLRADGPRLVRSVDAVERVAEIHGARAERVVRPARHVARQVGAALEHFFRRPPVRPLALGADLLDARPGEARPADADAVAQRLAVVLDQVEETLRRVDDDGPRFLAAAVVDQLAAIDRVHLVAPRLGVFGGLALYHVGLAPVV